MDLYPQQIKSSQNSTTKVLTTLVRHACNPTSEAEIERIMAQD
jgi:hypothetical protein